ncbi:hypothetical protein ACIBJI_41940 [Nocardia sp. NPDC050408]|uniref:hypothetical protein n=1 Tax=Nocardia sp. NPDC050408 TaxID=3364319 RepID=UPI00378774FA
MSHNLQTRDRQSIAAAIWAHIARPLKNQAGRLVAYLLRTPALLMGIFVAATVMQISLVLTVGNSQHDMRIPAATPPGTCAMFCTDSAPAAADPGASPSNIAAAEPHVTAVDTRPASVAPSSTSCWMFCPAQRTHVTALATSSTDPGSSAGTWRMDL